MVTRCIFFTQYSDMMISAIHSGTHQVGSASIQTDVFFIDMFFMDGFRNQCTIRCQHISAHFCEDSHIVHAGRHQHFFVYFTYTFANCHDITAFFIRMVRNTYTTRKVDKGNVNIQFIFQFHCQFKQNLGQHRIIHIRACAAGKERVDTEVFRTFFFQHAESFFHLFLCHAVFGIARVVHDFIAYLEYTAGIVTAAYGFRNWRNFFKERNMGNIVKVDDSTQFRCQSKIFRRCHIGRKHNLVSCYAYRFCNLQFCIRRTVCATAFFFQDLQNAGSRGCLHGKIFSKSFIPGKGAVYRTSIFPDAFFIINIKRCWISFLDFLYLFQ